MRKKNATDYIGRIRNVMDVQMGVLDGIQW